MSRRRERLASPLALTLVGLAFTFGFVVLAPPLQRSTEPDAPIDDLSLAYLKAQAGTDELDDDDAFDAMIALARADRISELRKLRDTAATRSLGPERRALLALETAAAGHRSADSSASAESARVELRRRLETLARAPAPQDRTLLARAVEISLLLDAPPLSARLYRRLAIADPARAADAYARCGRVLADRPAWADEAADCFREARAASTDRRERFENGLALLSVLSRPERFAPTPDSPASRSTSSPVMSAEAPSPPAFGGRSAERRRLERALMQDREAGREEREALARVLLAAERPGAAARVYVALAEHDPSARVHWLREAARWAEAADRPADAAVYLDRITGELPVEERAGHLTRIEALLLGAGEVDEALRSIDERLANRAIGPVPLREAVDFARQVGRTARAIEWNTRLLDDRPDDVTALRVQLELALSLGRLDVAEAAARRLIGRDAEDVAARTALAHVAEWRGRPEQALVQWRRLAGHRPDETRLGEVARLAELLRRPALAADARLALARQRAPSSEEVDDILRLHELDGRPDAAAAALEEIMRLHGTSPSALRALAALHERHVRHADALAAWERFAGRYGRSSEETLARMELHWRLGDADAAVRIARELERIAHVGVASDYQISLLAEIAWRYRRPALAALARPRLTDIDDADQRARHANRAIDALQSEGKAHEAIRTAETFWQSGGDAEFAIKALGIAIEHGDTAATRRLLASSDADETLRGIPRYWSLRAVVALREGDAEAAERAYRTALGIEPHDTEALGGLLWLLIGEGDPAPIEAFLTAHASRVESESSLWPAVAVAHVRTGEVQAALPWFERALALSERDYGFVLAYADALDTAGRADRALRVRRHALTALRPHLLAGVAGKREILLQHYAHVLARHGSAEANEAWMNYLLNTRADGADEGRLWREDMAITWLMATERHEHARLIMTRLHGRRLQTPRWQALALALREDDLDGIEAMLAAGDGLSAGDRIVALRRLGRDGEAFSLALRTLETPRSEADRRVALDQYASLRRSRPSDIALATANTTSGALDTREQTLVARHTVGASGIGFGLELVRRRFASDRLAIDGRGEEHDIAVSLFRENSRQRLRLGAGLAVSDDEELAHGELHVARRDRRGRREVSFDAAWNEAVDDSPELRLAGKRDRLALALESAVGDRGFARLQAEISDLSSRVSERRLARSLRTRAEIGLRERVGAIAWSSSLSAENVDNDRVAALPDELRLAPTSTLDGVVAAHGAALSLNGSIARGDPGSGFPEASSPRYYLNAGLGHAWPDRAFGLQLDAGVGIRVLGNDELSFTLSRGSRLGGGRARDDASSFGLNYRYRF